MASERTENYLKQIYGLVDQTGKVSTSLLSERLGVSSASVSEMLQRLAEEGLVKYVPYRGAVLTQTGRKHALRIIRRHRLWELFLVKFLQFRWDEIHEEAERLEHITSERLEERLDAALGHPQIDPHGHLIPSAEGGIEEDRPPALADAAVASTVTVLCVNDANPEVLQYLSKLGIGIHKTIVIKERIAVDGSLRVEIGGRELFISEKLARHIFVKVADPERRLRAKP
jgi:DtxR family Mn-dependent transcriptional regulator